MTANQNALAHQPEATNLRKSRRCGHSCFSGDAPTRDPQPVANHRRRKLDVVDLSRLGRYSSEVRVTTPPRTAQPSPAPQSQHGRPSKDVTGTLSTLHTEFIHGALLGPDQRPSTRAANQYQDNPSRRENQPETHRSPSQASGTCRFGPAVRHQRGLSPAACRTVTDHAPTSGLA